MVGVPIGVLRIADERLDWNDVGVLRNKEVAVEPGTSHVGVVLAQSGGEVGEDLLMECLDRHFGDVHLAARLFLPMRHMILQAVADGRLQNHHIDGGSFVRLGLEERHPLRGDRRLVRRLGRRIDQIAGGPRRPGQFGKHRRGQTELRAADDELAAADPPAHVLAHHLAELFVIVTIGHSFSSSACADSMD